MDGEKIDLVDKNGNVIGEITRGEAYKNGLLHPAVNILVFNSRGQLYLQKRSAKKSAFPLYWDISASEHVARGESYKEGAIRGLVEELSIEANVKLLRSRHVQKSEYEKKGDLIKEYELVELYGTIYDGKINIDPEEVAEGKFVLLEDLRNFDEANFTPWGLDEIKFILENPQVIGGLIR